MPAETTRIFVALRPDEALAALIGGHKRRLLAAAGPQMYLSDPPHTTLLVASFRNSQVAELLRSAEDLAAASPMPIVALSGWHVFADDALTGSHTLVCRLAEETCQRLWPIQRRALDVLAPLRDAAATEEAVAPRMPLLSREQQICVRQFGFPYVGDGWIPHLTIASVRPSQWPHAKRVFDLSQDLSSTCGQFTALDVFELHGLEPRLLAAFPLAPRHIGKVA